jgi:hypothetical protein
MKETAIWIIAGAMLLAVLGGGGWLAYSMLSEGAANPGEPKMTRGPAPEFVVAREPLAAKDAQYDPVEGVRLLLFDQQFDATASQPAMYTRTVKVPVNASGVSGAAKAIARLDPSYQTLVLNHAKVIRGGQVEDRSDRLKVDFLRQEPALDLNIITGAVTAVLQLEDVRVDDIVDVALTVRGANPSLKGKVSDVFVLAGPLAIERMAVRTIWPENSVWRVEDGKADVKETKEKGRLVLEVGPKPIPAVEFKPMSSELPEFPVLWVSGFADWKEVVAWGTPLFHTRPGPEVREVAAKIKSEHAEPGAQVIAALRFVQEDIRYLAIVLGEGGYKPQTPTETLKLRYGDCKAKTALLLAILSELGVEGVPALVNPALGLKVQDAVATPLAFDHVIAKVTFGGRTLWLDPTVTKQGGDIDHTTQADHGYALPLDGKAAGLERMTVPALQGLHAEVVETYDLRAGSDGPARVEVSIIARGAMADVARAGIEAAGGADKMLEANYKARFREVTALDTANLEDDLRANALTAKLSLALKSPFMTMGPRSVAMFEASTILPVLFASDSDAKKERDVAVAQLNSRHSIRLRLPEGPRWQLPEETQVVENEAFRFSRVSGMADGYYVVDFEMRPLASQLAPDKIRGALSDQGDVQQLTRLSFMIAGPREKTEPPRLNFPGVTATGD